MSNFSPKSHEKSSERKSKIGVSKPRKLLNSIHETDFDDIAILAASICNAPSALFYMLEAEGPVPMGGTGLSVHEPPWDFFAPSGRIEAESYFFVGDTNKQHPLFKKIWLNGEKELFCVASVPMDQVTRPGAVLVFDPNPSPLTTDQIRSLRSLSRQVSKFEQARSHLIGLERSREVLSNEYKDLRKFYHRLSHDLRAPLVASRRLIRYIVDDINDENRLEEAKANLETVVDLLSQAESLQDEVSELVDHPSETKIEVLDLEKLMGDILSRLKPLAIQQKCEIRIETSPAGEYDFDSRRVRQIIENLVSNAIKYRDPKKESSYASVKLEADQNQLQICVEDNGLGIPEKHQSKLFEAFERFHPEMGFGNGLGTFIIKKNVDELGGSISFATSPAGTRFNIDVPLTPRS